MYNNRADELRRAKSVFGKREKEEREWAAGEGVEEGWHRGSVWRFPFRKFVFAFSASHPPKNVIARRRAVVSARYSSIFYNCTKDTAAFSSTAYFYHRSFLLLFLCPANVLTYTSSCTFIHLSKYLYSFAWRSKKLHCAESRYLLK